MNPNRCLGVAILVGVAVSRSEAAGAARHAEPSFRATTETALESLPLAVRWPASAYLISGEPDLLGNIEEAAKLTASGHEPALKVSQGIPDLSRVVARLDEPGQGVSANFNAALGMHALIHRLAPYLAVNEDAARKFALADAAAMRRLPLAEQEWFKRNMDELVRNFTAGLAVEPEERDLAAVRAEMPAERRSPPPSAALSKPIEEKTVGTPVPAAGAVPADARPLEELAKRHPEAARELVRLTEGLKATVPGRYVWLDQPDDEMRTGLFDAGTLVILGPGFHNRTAFGSAGPIFAFNALLEADVVSGAALMVSGGRVQGKVDLRGRVITSGVGGMQDAFVNGRRVERPMDMDFVRSKIMKVSAGQ